MKILVVEDETKTAAYLRKGLTENGFAVDVAATGVDGLHCASEGDYQLVILDVLLPERDGWSVLSEIRKQGKHTPVLFLTARDSVQDKVKGLQLGADDYLVKPFAFSELLARIRALLRRGPARNVEEICVGDLVIDTVRHKATRNGDALDLTPKEFGLLTLLARHSGEVLSRTTIAETIWDINFDTDTNVIDVHVRRLRSKLDDPFPRKLLHTVRGVGYILEERG
ncbi:MAG TPA: heavy metal response regulator transcription factor [Candidatus Acidoferrales bacterium]|nr:heavy metal response regulator transcription factor [Candidatus Acidoferrales bacterium]